MQFKFGPSCSTDRWIERSSARATYYTVARAHTPCEAQDKLHTFRRGPCIVRLSLSRLGDITWVLFLLVSGYPAVHLLTNSCVWTQIWFRVKNRRWDTGRRWVTGRSPVTGHRSPVTGYHKTRRLYDRSGASSLVHVHCVL
jgi:hypothetical protein